MASGSFCLDICPIAVSIPPTLSMVLPARRTILVVKDGNVIEQGTHTELMTLGGTYAGLYNSQFS